jgi:hypothetical protein
VHLGERVEPLGDVDTSANVAKVLAARRVLASFVDAGRFDRERVTSFEFRYHFASVDTWLAYMAEHWTSASIAPAQVTRARELLSAGGGALVIRERVYAARYRRGRAPEDVREA